MSPVRWESPPLSAPSSVLAPTPPVLPSRRLSADCLALSLPIRPIALCRRHAQHLSYHCPDNSLLVQKSLRALRSHDDDMVTLPGGSELPAEIAYPFSSPSVSFSAHPFVSLSFLGSAPHPPPASQLFECVDGSLQTCKHVCRQTGLFTAPSLLFRVTREQQIDPQMSSDTDTDLHEMWGPRKIPPVNTGSLSECSMNN